MKRLKKIIDSQDRIAADRGFRARHTFAELDAIYSAHNGCCDICSAAPGKRNFALDHDHASGKLRGLLCSSCNTALGLFKDDELLLAKAIKYLRDRR